MKVALVHQVFHDDPGGSALRATMEEAARQGAEVAVLPELPLNPWSAAQRTPIEADAEPPEGPRHQQMSAAAAAAGVALVGGAIIREPSTGARYNTALLFGSSGELLSSYRKVHLPEEEGYWETSHYEPGTAPPTLATGLSMRAGLQVCSDVNRPQGFQLLAAAGAGVVFAPRATPPATYDRWRLILRANAIMSGAFVVSVNRPGPENGASIGGPSVAIDPFGRTVAESTEPLSVVALDPTLRTTAAGEYPGYLKRFPDVYARGWSALDD